LLLFLFSLLGGLLVGGMVGYFVGEIRDRVQGPRDGFGNPTPVFLVLGVVIGLILGLVAAVVLVIVL
jgi:hypothetical protein